MSVTDFHSHLMPGVDDGARDAAQARAGVEAFRAAGVLDIITTPHLNASVTRDPVALAHRLGELDQAWQELVRVSSDSGANLHRGVELALDVPLPDLSERRVRLAGTAFVLVEFAFMWVPPNAENVLGAVLDQGCQPILAHPERYGRMDAECELALNWRGAGAFLQVNGASLLGRYGRTAQATALRLLELGLADYISSDFHCRGEPGIPDYRRVIEDLGGVEQAQLLLEVNPGRILTGQLPEAVPPLERRRPGLRERMRRIFR